MKNSIQRYLCSLLFLIYGTTLICQTELDQFSVGLRLILPTYNLEYLYVPTHDDFISIRKKSDLKFSFNRTKGRNESRDWNGKISDFTLGYSPLQHLYGTANLSLIRNKESRGLYDSQMVLGGVGIGGYFLKENIDRDSSKWKMPDKGLLINALVGYSRGKISHNARFRVGLGKFILNQFYGKIGFDYQSRFWGIATNIRFGLVNYGTTKIEGHAYDGLVLQRELLTTQNNFLFGEFSCRAYLGIKYGQLYVNATITKVNGEIRQFVLSDLFGVGIVLDIQEIFKKKNKNED